MNATKLYNYAVLFTPCLEIFEYINNQTFEQAWNNCENPYWMISTLQKTNIATYLERLEICLNFANFLKNDNAIVINCINDAQNFYDGVGNSATSVSDAEEAYEYMKQNEKDNNYFAMAAAYSAAIYAVYPEKDVDVIFSKLFLNDYNIDYSNIIRNVLPVQLLEQRITNQQ